MVVHSAERKVARKVDKRAALTADRSAGHSVVHLVE